MPPTHTDEGIVAAQQIHAATQTSACCCCPSTSTRCTPARLLEEVPSGAGYLLKDRVSDIAVLTDAIHRVAEGECVIDPTIVSRLVQAGRGTGRSTS